MNLCMHQYYGNLQFFCRCEHCVDTLQIRGVEGAYCTLLFFCHFQNFDQINKHCFLLSHQRADRIVDGFVPLIDNHIFLMHFLAGIVSLPLLHHM